MDIELLQTKSLSDLREIAKLAGVKSVTTYKKAELLQKLIDMAGESEREQEQQRPQEEQAEQKQNPEIFTDEFAMHPDTIDEFIPANLF